MNQSMRRHCYAVTTLVLLQSAPVVAHAQAYCALRDPAPQIYSLFPQATNFRSHVNVIDQKSRADVGALLPFTLRTRELGQHTLYVAQAATRPVGLVHVRSEPSDWGLVEIAWSLDLQGRILDYRFQRCRGRACDEVATGPLRALLANKELRDLRVLLTSDGEQLSPALLAQEPEGIRQLAAVVVRSAAKTAAVTRVVWGAELHPASAQR
jgi:hypothetical protein